MGMLKWLSILLISIIISGCNNEQIDMLTYTEFQQQAEIKEETAVIGTNIKLHQEIHGKDGIQYRYKLETDCPHWSYEDRYVTEKPLTWINKYSAVETEATSIEILVNDMSFASGSHFYVPLLDLNQDDMDYETYKENLQKDAYQSYKSYMQQENGAPDEIGIMLGCIILIIMLLFVWQQKLSKQPFTK